MTEQIIITLLTTALGSILSYFAAVSKTKSELEGVRINADTEIAKIREESAKEVKKLEAEHTLQIEKMRVETEEQIKLEMAKSDSSSKESEEKLKMQFMEGFLEEFMKNPAAGIQKAKQLEKAAKSINSRAR